MAFADTNRVAAAGFLSRAVARLAADFAAWNEARATRAALSKLSDHELEDIGLMRGDIDHLSDRALMSR
jgi:uncharacterized protein YjiS (DUF1127 family)